MRLYEKIIETISSRYYIFLILIILLTIPLFLFFAKQDFYNHMEVYFNKDDKHLNEYNNFKKTYGNELQFIIIVNDKELFTASNINLIKRLSESIENMEGVSRVFSITEAEEVVGKKDTIFFQKFIPDGELTNNKLIKLKKKILADKILPGSLISRDGTTAAIVAELDELSEFSKKHNLSKDKAKKKLIDMIKKQSRDIAGSKKNIRFVGVPYIETELNSLTKKDSDTLIPITLFIIFLMITFLLRNIALSFIALINLLFILIWSTGFFVLFGEKFNIITGIMGSILLAIAVADSIHYLSQFRDEALIIEKKEEAVSKSLKHIWMACFFTTLTTAIGFLSFSLSSIRPVKILGVFSAIGVVIAFFMTVIFLPSVLHIATRKFGLMKNRKKEQKQIKYEKKSETSWPFLMKIGNFTVNQYKVISLLFIPLLLATSFGISKISFETSDIKYLSPSHPIRIDTEFVEKKIGGTIPYNILIKAKSQSNNFQTPESLKLLNEIQSYLMKNIKHFSSSYSIADYYKGMNKALNEGMEKYYTIPSSKELVLDLIELSDSEVYDRFVSPNHMEARISFQAKWASNEEGHRIIKDIKNYIQSKIEKNYSFSITGFSFVYLQMEKYLKKSQIQSFLIAFIIIFIIMFFICRKPLFTVLCMIPNIFPIAATLGIMGWFKIPLDIATIMIAGVTIGIAVDDTIHFTVRFRENFKKSNDYADAVIETFRNVGKQLVITSIVLFLGFMVLIGGSLKPTQAFGALTALSILFALIGDLIILPALLILFKPKI